MEARGTSRSVCAAEGVPPPLLSPALALLLEGPKPPPMDHLQQQSRSCRIPGCTVPLRTGFSFKYRICLQHYSCPSLTIDGSACRFCQQCCQIHALAAFDGVRRSCREALQRHQACRLARKKRQQAQRAQRGCQPGLLQEQQLMVRRSKRKAGQDADADADACSSGGSTGDSSDDQSRSAGQQQRQHQQQQRRRRLQSVSPAEPLQPAGQLLPQESSTQRSSSPSAATDAVDSKPMPLLALGCSAGSALRLGTATSSQRQASTPDASQQQPEQPEQPEQQLPGTGAAQWQQLLQHLQQRTDSQPAHPQAEPQSQVQAVLPEVPQQPSAQPALQPELPSPRLVWQAMRVLEAPLPNGTPDVIDVPSTEVLLRINERMGFNLRPNTQQEYGANQAVPSALQAMHAGREHPFSHRRRMLAAMAAAFRAAADKPRLTAAAAAAARQQAGATGPSTPTGTDTAARSISVMRPTAASDTSAGPGSSTAAVLCVYEVTRSAGGTCWQLAAEYKSREGAGQAESAGESAA